MIITELPFFYKSHPLPDNGGYPHVLPFNIYFDEELNMFRQQANSELNAILKKVYEEGSLVEGSISNESGKVYVEKTLNFIVRNIEVSKKNVLEIGCGDGTMLVEFFKKGANVIGIEPGNHPENRELGEIEIIRDFFPSKKIKNKFDIIFNYGVLEHIDNFLSFLLETKKALKKNGRLIISIPNCEPFLDTGDVSIFIHEHYNYFTRESLSRTVKKVNLEIEKLEIIEGTIIAIIAEEVKQCYRSEYIFNLKQYFDKAEKFNNHLRKIFKKYQSNEVAIYVPARALNVLSQIGVNNVRLIDDSSQLHGKYLPFFTKAVENYNDMLNSPPKCLLIFSRVFGERIKQKCKQQKQLFDVEIITLDELH